MAELKAVPADPYNGSPIVPTGDPMKDGLGPAAWAERSDTPDLTAYGQPKVVPLRAAPGFHVNPQDPNPVGLAVKGADGAVAGTIREVWVDRSEPQVRYYEVELAGGGGRRLLPAAFVQWPWFGLVKADHVLVKAITAAQFAGVPTTKSDTQVTFLEEDRIGAYYAGGHLYATPDRAQPWI
jgi:photosynthetic reaction center H subunit